MTLSIESPPVEDLAELLERLGNVPANRILVRPAPGTATEVDVLAALNARRKRICELVDGVLVEKAMGYTESLLTGALVELLRGFVRPRNLGLITLPDGTIRLWAGRVRIPDVAYFSWERIPGRRIPEEAIPSVVPDLAVEVLSESNTAAEMRIKREDYFSAGVTQVWEIDPKARTVNVYTTVDAPDICVTEADTLRGEPVLPGFTLPLRSFFAELDQRG